MDEQKPTITLPDGGSGARAELDVEQTDAVLQCPLFEGVGRADALALICAPGTRTVRCAAGEDARCGDSVCVLLSGRAAVFSDKSGDETPLRELTPGDCFGAASVFCGGLQRVRARKPCVLLLLSRGDTEQAIRRSPDFACAYVRFLCQRVAFLNRKIDAFTAGSACERLRAYLSTLPREGGTVTLPVSLSRLPSVLDIGRASLYRAFDALEAQGVLSREGRKITIINL